MTPVRDRPATDLAGRIPSLDGVRAVAIALLLASHLIGTRGFPVTTTPLVDLGALGVRIFFVLSGLLITSLLVAEERRTGRVDLPAFYARRTIRIFPAFYAYLVALALLAVAGVIEVPGTDLLRAASYTINYSHAHDWRVGHAWSLAVEEQFYLTWPLLIAWLGTRRAAIGAMVAVAAAPVVRVVLMALPDGTSALQPHVGHSFETVVDAIATGALLALVRERLWARTAFRRLLDSPAVWMLVPVGFAAGSLPFWDAWVAPRTAWFLTGAHAAVGLTLLNVSIALLIERVVRHPDDLVGRTLNLRLVARLGTLSYSVYIWQQLFLDRRSDAWATRFPQNLLLVFAAALLSYHLVERPMLRLRDRLLRPHAPKTP